MSKMPWLKLWYEDLERDCRNLTLEARGAWVWIIGNLRHFEGQRELTLAAWSRFLGADIEKTRAVLEELIDSQTADAEIDGVFYGKNQSDEKVTRHASVTRDGALQKSDARVTLISRRLAREHKSNKAHASRQKRYRDKMKRDASDDGTVTREKQKQMTVTRDDASPREAPSMPVPARELYKKRSRFVPEDYEITEKDIAWATLERPDLDLKREIAIFRDHEFDKPKTNWSMAFRNWIRKADKFKIATGKNKPDTVGAPAGPPPAYACMTCNDSGRVIISQTSQEDTMKSIAPYSEAGLAYFKREYTREQHNVFICPKCKGVSAKGFKGQGTLYAVENNC